MKDHIEIDGVRYVREASLPTTADTEAVLLAGEPSYGGGSLVQCPNCGSDLGLHINGLRLENAAGQKLVVTAGGEDAKSHISLNLSNEGSIEGRRYELSLTGECENCTDFALTFTQHKGQTYFSRA
ncbi:hypothetical protein [Arthrobacter bussei]|uniref:Uncharacterized protein n=1 Tax=Arthrobacter bussei TaxID=2594179 RepID=A0A7X1NSQ6_9MICC|nr:hypothetical protein [Arthrobacter bussei]MPY12315.1 hypothetical protein [Arthrobacter bussei]